MVTEVPQKQKSLRSDFDHPWKHALQLYFREFMEFCLPHIAIHIDWGKGYELLEQELNAITGDAKIGNRIADKLIKVFKKDGKETLILCHLEIDGSPRNKLPKRMMIYRYRIFDLRHLPIISIAILIDDDPNWRVDRHREECFGTYQEIGYLIIKLLDYQKRRKELESMHNRFAVIMLAQLTVLETKHDAKARLYAKTALTRSLYEKGYIKEDIQELFKLIDWLITLPEELVIEYNQAIKHIEEEKQVEFITTPERVGIMKGFQQGMEKGIEKGIHKGMRKGEAAMLTRLLRRRFGRLSIHYHKKIQEADAKTLLIWAERILDASSLEEVLS